MIVRLFSSFLVISSKVDEKDEKDSRMSPYIAHHGEGGEEQEQRHTEEILFHFPVVVCFDCYFTLQIYI